MSTKKRVVRILETERLILREITADDTEFILDLLNQPSFIRYIGDRNVKTPERAQAVIENRYRQSYHELGYGLYVVELKETLEPIGFCGFVRREGLPETDIGFAFLPQFEKKGYAFESADAVMKYGRYVLNLRRVLAITSPDNESSIRLLEKLGFKFEKMLKLPPNNEEVRLFSSE